MNDFSLNIPSITISELIKLLTELYANAIEKNIPFRSIPTVYLSGPPGVGKSQGVRQIADNLKSVTGLKTVTTDIRLMLFSPIDLRGVPVADANREFTVWLKPKIFDMDKGEDTVNILFLDELSSAPQSVQAAAYQICLDRKIGEHRLPENCIVLAAGNRTTDQSVAYKMPKALANRMMHFNITSSYDSWKEWAVKHSIDHRIIDYLDMDRTRLCITPEPSETAYPTPRSWEFVSNIMKSVKAIDDYSSIMPLIAGLIGNDRAYEFIQFCKNNLNMPSIADIIKGKCFDIPDTDDTLYALNNALINEVKNGFLNDVELEHICAYVYMFPKDYIKVFYDDVTENKSVRMRFSKLRIFQSLAMKMRGNADE